MYQRPWLICFAATGVLVGLYGLYTSRIVFGSGHRSDAGFSLVERSLRSNYFNPSIIGCQPKDFPAPGTNVSGEAFYSNLYRASECLIDHVIIPSIVNRNGEETQRRRSLKAAQRPGCNSGTLSDFGTTRGQGWKALAERSLCVLEERLYDVVTSEKLGRARGMYINSSR